MLRVALPWLLMVAAESASAAPPPPPPKRSEVERLLATSHAAQPSGAPLRPLTIVLVADQKDHGAHEHDYPRWQARWALLLGGAAASREPAANLFGPDRPHPALPRGAQDVRVLTAQGWPATDQWQTADLVVVFCYVTWGPERLEEVRRYLGRGGGLVLIHSATWTKPGPSPEVAAVTGVGGFQRWRHGAVAMEITARDHPVCRGLPTKLPLVDETYWPPTPAVDAARVQVLAISQEATAPGQPGTSPQPLFWTYVRDSGRVFGCVPGHYSWTFDDPYFRLLLLRGLAWAARENPSRFEALVLRSAAVADD